MAKKKQRGARKQKDTLQSQPLHILEQNAEASMAKSAYKEAIEYYKALLKREQQPAWITRLSEAYLGRGRDLAAKGMFKEAVVIWENRSTTCGDDSEQVLYLEWLLKAGRYGRAAQLYHGAGESFANYPGAQNLPALIGAISLSGQQELRKELSQFGQWDAQIEAAEKVLKAYTQRRPAEELDALLKQISIRSPFRDFRTLIKSLLVLETNVEEAQRLANKIPADSPYKKLIDLLPNPRAWDKPPPKPVKDQEAFVIALYGWNAEQVKAFQALLDYQDGSQNNSPRALFKLMLKHYRGIGEAYVRLLGKQWLPTLGFKEFHSYNSVFKLPDFENLCLKALTVEVEEDKFSARYEWQEALEAIEPHLDDPAERLKAALLQRHIIDARSSARKNSISALEKPLQNCIQWRPDDKQSWLDLIALYRENDIKKSYADWVNKALEQFPKDVDILLVAVEAASHRNAFKKAAGYAEAILKIDPINVQARNVLIDSHLNHARKQFKANKLNLVEKELKAAASYERGSTPNFSLLINRGLLAFASGQKAEAKTLLETVVNKTGTSIGSYALVILEADKINIDSSLLVQTSPTDNSNSLLDPLVKTKQALDFLKPFKKTDDYKPDIEELKRLPGLLKPYLGEDKLAWFFDEWQPLLKKILTQSALEWDDLILLCDFFKQIPSYDLLLYYAEQGLKKWENAPQLIFYQVYAKVDGDSFAIGHDDFERLENALNDAYESDNHRARILIQNFLEEESRSGGFDDDFDDDFEDDLFDDFPGGGPLSMEDDIEQIFNNEEALHEMFGGRVPPKKKLMALPMEVKILLVMLAASGRPIPKALKQKLFD